MNATLLMLLGVLTGGCIGLVIFAISVSRNGRPGPGASEPGAGWPRRLLRWSLRLPLAAGALLVGLGLLALVAATIAAGAVSEDPASLAAGLAIGLLAAPWLFLHFSRTQTPDEAARFRFLSIMLAAATGVAVALPLLREQLTNADVIEISGLLKLSGTQQQRASGAEVAFGSGALQQAKLQGVGEQDGVRAIRQIRLIGGGPEDPPLNTAPPANPVQEPQRGRAESPRLPYSRRPMIGRDALVAAYLASRSDPQRFAALLSDDEFVRWGAPLLENRLLFATLARPLGCLEAAAITLRDVRLLLFDNHVTIRWFLRLAIAREGEQPSSPPFAVLLEDEAKAEDPGIETALDPIVADWRRRLVEPNRDTVQLIAGRSAADAHCPEKEPFRPDFLLLAARWGGLRANQAPPLEARRMKQLRSAPYTAMAAAELFQAIGGAESALLILTRWIAQQPTGPLPDTADGALRAWMTTRAVIDLVGRLPTDRVDMGNRELVRLLDIAPAALSGFLPDLATWLASAACEAGEDASRPLITLFRETEQELMQAMLLLRLWAFRARRGAHLVLPTELGGEEMVTEALIEEAAALRRMRASCFPLASQARGSAHHLAGSVHLAHAELLRVAVERALPGQAAPNERQRARLEEARTAYRRAIVSLRRHQSSESEARSEAARGTLPDCTADRTRLDCFAPWAREVQLLLGDAPTVELTTAMRGEVLVDAILRRR